MTHHLSLAYSSIGTHHPITMLTDRIKELEATKAKVSALESEIETSLRSELSGLPAKFGFDSVNSFIAAVRAASGKRRGRKPSTKNTAPKAAKKRRRAKITDATRAEVKKLAEAGKTGAEISKALKISLPSVQNIKKALGLVKAKK